MAFENYLLVLNSIHFNPGAYLLKLRCLLIHRCGESFHSRFQFCNGRFLLLYFAILLLDFAMLFEELVK